MKEEEKGTKEGEKKAVFLPAELYGRIEERVRATEFRSVEEYVTFVLVLFLVSDFNSRFCGDYHVRQFVK